MHSRVAFQSTLTWFGSRLLVAGAKLLLRRCWQRCQQRLVLPLQGGDAHDQLHLGIAPKDANVR